MSTSNLANGTSMIDAACIAFHKSVSAFITKSHKRNRHRPREHGDDYDDDGRGDGDDTNANDVDDNAAKCIELVEHANHVLRTLFAKRLSLQNAIVAFREASELYVQQFGAATTTCTSIESEVNNNAIRQEDDRQRQRILRNWFANYIRLRDGFVLLESGERRHPHDGDNNFNRFTSKLKGAYRSDGITRKFSSSNGYTGTGYDEVYDEDVGIKRRLLEALSDIDCHGGRKRRSVASINDKLFDGDNYGNGAQLWEGCMDEHIRDSKVLRDTLNSIQVKFVNDINNHLLTIGESDRGGGGPARAASVKKKKMKLNLVTDDKFERMTLGDIVDIARQGNAFTLQDAGGSLPIGMTVQDWRQRFGVIPTAVTAAAQSTASTKVEKVTVKKKRKVILEDSSEEEEDDKEADNTTASCKTNKSATTKQLRMAPEISSDPAVASSQKRTIATTDNDDGLTVRMRKATDVSNDSCNGRISAGETYVNTAMEDYTSIDEMKRKLGVNNAQLERGRELLENEQLLSRIAADEEDMREEILLRDGNTTTANHHHGNHIFAAHANLLRKIYASRNDLRKKNVLSYNSSDDIELLRESQEYWAAFDDSVLRWNDQLQSFGDMRKEVSDGILDESSDRAYTIRENFREANMLLGIDAMEVYEFYSQLERETSTTQNRFTGVTRSSFSSEDTLFDVCLSCLKFAKETFNTALSLVLEHERHHTNSPATIDRHWEKGQHLLLRGRAHHNIGHAIYEMAEYTSTVSNRKQQHQRQRGKDKATNDLLIKAKDEFAKAVQGARAIRHNAIMIYGHHHANDTSSQSNYTWMAEATMHKLEAMKLELLASGFHILCSWKIDDSREEAVNMFHEVTGSVEISDVLKLASGEGVSTGEVAEVLGDMYWFAMRVAQLSTQSIEGLSIGKDWNAKAGEDSFHLTRIAMQRASVVSEHLLSFVHHHSLLDYAKELGIATPAKIIQEEREICNWWETIKKQATTRMSDVTNTHRSGSLATFPRGEVGAGMLHGPTSNGVAAAPLTRRVFVQDDRALQDRSLSCRTTRRVKKKNIADDDRNVAEQFSSEFSPTTDAVTSDAPYSNRVLSSSDNGYKLHSSDTSATVVYRKWGNEILEPHERKRRCCPPLPENFVELGISIDVIRALRRLQNKS